LQGGQRFLLHIIIICQRCTVRLFRKNNDTITLLRDS
jgi:hypothetical protein